MEGSEEDSQWLTIGDLLVFRMTSFNTSAMNYEKLDNWKMAGAACDSAKSELARLQTIPGISKGRTIHYAFTVQSTYGWHLLQQGDIEAAIAVLRAAERECAKLYQAAPDQFRSRYSLATYRLGVALAEANNEEAITQFDECVALRSQLVENSPDSPTEKKGLALARARAGELETAVKLADELLQSADVSDVEMHVDLARVYAICASMEEAKRAEPLHERALELLEMAIDHGYRNAAIDREPDLKSVRDSARFKQLYAMAKEKPQTAEK